MDDPRKFRVLKGMSSVAVQPSTVIFAAEFQRPSQFESMSEYSPSLTRIQPPAIFRASGLGVSTKVRLSTRKAVAAASVVLHQWRVGFTHDWKVTVNATNFPQMKKSLLRWFREPISSKRMASSKNQAV